MIGRTIGKYRIVGQLGRGGMGTVYRAVDETLDREVAIKILNPELADTEVMKRFRAEATTLAKLNHPEIATIYELFRSEDDLLMVMEFVKGETLDKLSDRAGALPPDQAAHLVDRVLAALEHAHRAGIVHRDMKPANVMVTEHGGVKIMDFGIARVRGAEHVTVDGYMMGTPAYIPPEQVLGQEVDGRADLYSVGVVFYRLLTGALPFKADTAIGMIQKQISDTPIPLHLHREGLPPWCDEILGRALAKSPADRFQTAEEFRAAIAAATGAAPANQIRAFATNPTDTTSAPTAIAVSAEMITTTPLGVERPVPAADAPKAAPGPAPASGERATVVIERKHFAVAGTMLAIMAAGVVVLAFVALRAVRLAPGSAPAPAAVASATTAAGSASAVDETPALQTQAQATVQGGAAHSTAAPEAASGIAATPKIGTSAAWPDPARPAASDAGGASAAAPAAGDPHVLLGKRTAAEGGTVGSATAGGADNEKLPLMFDAKALVGTGRKQHEREAKVLLADGKVTITADNKDVLHAVPYGAVESVSYSRGRDPLWHSPAGPRPVVRMSGGTFGFIRGERHWVALRTKNHFVVLRLQDDQVTRVLTALQERTGHAAERVVERKDPR